MNNYTTQGRIVNSIHSVAAIDLRVAAFVAYAQTAQCGTVTPTVTGTATRTPTPNSTPYQPVPVPVFEFEWYWLQSLLQALAALAAAGIDPPLPEAIVSPGNYTPAANEISADIQVTGTLSGTNTSGELRTDLSRVQGDLEVEWASTANLLFQYTGIQSPNAIVRNEQGVEIGSGSVSVSAPLGNAVVSGDSFYYLNGSGDVSFYAPALAELAVSGQWASYEAEVLGDAVIAVEGGAVTVGGQTFFGRHTIETTQATIIGQGQTAMPEFSEWVWVGAEDAVVSLGEAAGELTVAGLPVNVSRGLRLDGFDGQVMVYVDDATRDTVYVTGDPAHAFTLNTVPMTSTTFSNAPVTFQAQIDANFDDTYSMTVKAPLGWVVELDAGGQVTALPPAGAPPGDYTILVTAQSQSYPDLFVYAEHLVTTIPFQGLELAVAEDELITVPWGEPEASPLLFAETNNGQIQLPDAAYTINITNTSTVDHIFEVNVSGLPAGWLLLSGAQPQETTTAISLPAGGVGQLGLYVSPDSPALPAAGTEYPFSVTVNDLDGAGLSESDSATFTMPAVAFNHVTAAPSLVYVAPDTPADFTLSVENVGNVSGVFPITVTMPVTGWTSSYVNSTGSLAAGSTYTQVVTFTPVGATAGQNKTIRVDSPAPGSAYVQSSFVQVAVRAPEVVCAFGAVQSAPDSDPGLLAALDNLLTQLELWNDLNDLGQRDRTVAALQGVVTQLNSYAGLAVAGQLSSLATQISNHSAPADLASDRAALGNILCQDLRPALQLLSAYNPALAAFPTVLVTIPGRTVSTTLTIINHGQEPATAQFSLADVPAGWTVVAPSPVSLQPGVAQQLLLPVTPNVLGTGTFSIVMQLAEAPNLVITRTLAVRVVSELLTITEVALDPDFLNVGTGTTDVSIRLANPAGLRASTTANVQLTDSSGVVRKSLATPFTVAVNNSGPFLLGQLDIGGLEQGVYTATVRILDLNGSLIPNATGFTHLAIGQNLQVTVSRTPSLVPPGQPGLTVTTAITTGRTDVLSGTVPFTPTLKWAKSSFSVQGTYNQVLSMPAIADINLDGTPDVIFTTYRNDIYTADGILRVISGDDGSEIFSITAQRVMPLSSPLIVDLENDGIPEIVAERDAGGFYAFSNTGALKYTSPAFANPAFGSTPAVADMNGDGLPEIVVGRFVLNNTLSTVTDLGSGGGPGGGSEPLMTGLVADVNLDGQPEVVVAHTIYNGSGGVMAQNPALPTFGVTNAIGNFDQDAYPEIVLVFSDPDFSPPFNGGNNTQVYLLDHQMNVVWGPVSIPKSSTQPAGGNGGPPTVADFDGDGMPEIGIAGHSNYIVLDTDGTTLWTSVTQDYSSGYTGSSVFDFQGDGRAEVVYADERYLRIYDGPTGDILFQEPHASVTGYELPVTADVDGDGHAEIIVAANNYFCGLITCGGSFTGIRVFESLDDSWASTRRVWYQHAYDVVSLDDNLRVVTNPTPVWLLYNTFRSQAPTPAQGNAYFVDIRHHLPAAGAELLPDTISPVPLSVTLAEIHWLYSQQDREEFKVSQLGQLLVPALQPGEARPISTGTVISYTLNNNTTVVTIPPIYVSAPHIIAIEPAEIIASPGDTAVYTVTLTNAFSTTQSINLEVLGLPASWISMTETATLASGEVMGVPLVVATPLDADVQEYTLLVQALPASGGEDAASAVLALRAGPQLSISPALQFAEYGETVTYTLRLTNTVNQAEQYAFAANGLGTLPVELPAPVSLAPGQTVSRVMTVTAQTSESTIPFLVQADSPSGLSAGAEAGLGLLDGPAVQAALSPALVTLGRGATAIYTLTVTNTGSIRDVYDLSVNLPAGWDYTLEANGIPVTNLTLTPYAFNAASLRLLVTTALTTTPDLYPVEVVVASQDTPTVSATAQAQAQVAAQGVQVSIDPQSVTMSPTGSQTWDVTVTNTGEVADSFALQAGGIVSGTAQFAPAIVSLAPGASAVVQMAASDLDFALPVTYPIAVTARSTTDPDVFDFDQAEVTFTGYEDVVVAITPELKVVDGFASEHQFVMVITNTGNIGTVYDLGAAITPSGNVTPELDTLYIPAHMTVYVLINVSVGSAGTYEITVEADSPTSAAADSATATLIINSLNTAPIAVDDSATTAEDMAATIDVLANDTDGDGDPLTIESVTQPANGSVLNNGDDVTYTPNANFYGTDSFTYTINDGNGETATATVTVTVTPVNDSPVAVNDSATTAEDTAVAIDVLANDSDEEGDTLVVDSVTQPGNGTAAINPDNTITYTPDENFNGADSFTYTAGDGNGGSATATVAVAVSPVNDDPLAVDDAATTPEDTPVTVDVLANDSDVDGDVLAVASITQPANGTAVLNLDDTITYTPTATYNGPDSLTYTISDGNGGTATATLSIVVTAINNNPTAVDDSATTPEDTPLTIDVLANDSDVDGDTL
ncbi:MAG: tandem-95 repeat protein, partial [Chloroflexi bacterium]|nr:tandem-95 repeat protein [Chloroflexota bacterium]